MLDENVRKKCLFYVGRALRLAEKRYKQYSGSYMYDSIRNQLIYLYDVLEKKKENEDETIKKFNTFTMGIYASRELEPNDEIFADRIHDASYIATQIYNGKTSGLKKDKTIKLPNDPKSDPNYYQDQERLKKEYPDDYYV